MLWGTIARTLLHRRLARRPRPRTGPEPLRVLLVTGSFPPMRCGVGDYTAQLAKALTREAGVQVEVLTTATEQGGEAQPWLLRRMQRWTMDGLQPYRDLLATFQPDVVHLQYPTQGYDSWRGAAVLPAIARREAQASVVQTWHEYPQPLTTAAGLAHVAMGAAIDALIYVRPDYEQHLKGSLAALLHGVPRYFVPNAASVPIVVLSESERERVRVEMDARGRRLVAFFGFAFPHKGVHLLFDVADPARDHLLLIGELRESDPYHAELLAKARSTPWQGHVTVNGFATSENAARYLAAADAVLFPFKDGGGVWNSSVHAAMAQGTFTLVASRLESGYAADENAYYARPGDIAEMKAALDKYAGTRKAPESGDEWQAVAAQHVEIYRTVVARGASA
jgi:glycosyltransferase involved in cell wall biosynthesis